MEIIIIAVIVIIGIVVFQLIYQKQAVKKFMESDNRFKGCKVFTGAMGHNLLISENGFLAIKTPNLKEFKVLNINEINGFDIIKNGQSSMSAGKAIAGGVLFGGIGLLIGALSKKEKIKDLKFVFSINDFNNPTIEFNLIDGKVSKDGILGKAAQNNIQEISSLLAFLEKKYLKS